MEALERRALVMLVAVALLTFESIRIVPVQTWLLAFVLFGLACLAAASVFLVVVIAPAEYVGRWDSERPRLLFFAYAAYESSTGALG